MHDLLTDSLIGVRTPEGERRLALPELFAALSAGQIEGYTGLRAHQADPWHVFLVQLAASIQARRPTDALPTDPAYWCEGLLDLAEGIPEAWQLVVEDVSKPAFMQHPWSKGANYKVCAHTPDEFDVLFTIRNHDVKSARIEPSNIEAWIYALVTRQTIAPYGGGKGTLQGIVRMNSGSGSRPIVAWVEDLNPSKRFINECKKLCELRKKVIEGRYGFKDGHGVVTTWAYPWDHKRHQFISFNDLEPWFIEAPRLIRLRAQKDKIVALQAPTKSSIHQIYTNPYNGDVGDPWIPITRDGTALKITSSGFTAEILYKLVFKTDIQKNSGLLELLPATSKGFLVASALAGGNCKTNGFHRIELPVPQKFRLALFQQKQRDALADLASQFLSDAADIEKSLSISHEVMLTELGQATMSKKQSEIKAIERLLEAKRDKNISIFDRYSSWISSTRQQFIKQWEALYFPTLWRGADEAHEAVRADWQQRLVDMAQALLDEASTRLPLPANRRWRAITQAGRAFIGMLQKAKLPLPAHNRFEPLATEETAV